MGNLHSIGEMLTNAMRSEVAGHDIRIRNGSNVSGTFSASSPPIGQEVLSETGIDFKSRNRVFYIQVSDLDAGDLSEPTENWRVEDMSDNSFWRLLPDEDGHCWRWHGQTRSAIQITTKQDK